MIASDHYAAKLSHVIGSCHLPLNMQLHAK